MATAIFVLLIIITLAISESGNAPNCTSIITSCEENITTSNILHPCTAAEQLLLCLSASPPSVCNHQTTLLAQCTQSSLACPTLACDQYLPPVCETSIGNCLSTHNTTPSDIFSSCEAATQYFECAQLTNCISDSTVHDRCDLLAALCPALDCAGATDSNSGQCTVTEWSEWSECSMTCGLGVQHRIRQHHTDHHSTPTPPSSSSSASPSPSSSSPNCALVQTVACTNLPSCGDTPPSPSLPSPPAIPSSSTHNGIPPTPTPPPPSPYSTLGRPRLEGGSGITPGDRIVLKQSTFYNGHHQISPDTELPLLLLNTHAFLTPYNTTQNTYYTISTNVSLQVFVAQPVCNALRSWPCAWHHQTLITAGWKALRNTNLRVGTPYKLLPFHLYTFYIICDTPSSSSSCDYTFPPTVPTYGTLLITYRFLSSGYCPHNTQYIGELSGMEQTVPIYRYPVTTTTDTHYILPTTSPPTTPHPSPPSPSPSPTTPVVEYKWYKTNCSQARTSTSKGIIAAVEKQHYCTKVFGTSNIVVDVPLFTDEYKPYHYLLASSCPYFIFPQSVGDEHFVCCYDPHSPGGGPSTHPAGGGDGGTLPAQQHLRTQCEHKCNVGGFVDNAVHDDTSMLLPCLKGCSYLVTTMSTQSCNDACTIEYDFMDPIYIKSCAAACHFTLSRYQRCDIRGCMLDNGWNNTHNPSHTPPSPPSNDGSTPHDDGDSTLYSTTCSYFEHWISCANATLCSERMQIAQEKCGAMKLSGLCPFVNCDDPPPVPTMFNRTVEPPSAPNIPPTTTTPHAPTLQHHPISILHTPDPVNTTYNDDGMMIVAIVTGLIIVFSIGFAVGIYHWRNIGARRRLQNAAISLDAIPLMEAAPEKTVEYVNFDEFQEHSSSHSTPRSASGEGHATPRPQDLPSPSSSSGLRPTISYGLLPSSPALISPPRVPTIV